MKEKDRTGEYVVELRKDGAFYSTGSLNCGARTFQACVKAWKKRGFEVIIKQEPA